MRDALSICPWTEYEPFRHREFFKKGARESLKLVGERLGDMMYDEVPPCRLEIAFVPSFYSAPLIMIGSLY